MTSSRVRISLALGLVALWSAGCVSTSDHSQSHSAPLATPAAPAASLAPMPEAVTSFGAATTGDGWLYVAGGHRGERHAYDAEQVSGSAFRLNLAEGQTWERLPDTLPGQGFPLAAHGPDVFRVGGMAALNPPGTKQDLRSQTDVLRFNAQKGRWEALPPLPEPRSSHDAVFVGDRLYVIGGWRLDGGTNAPIWPDHALVFDLNQPEAGWTRIPQPFQRRALAVATRDGRIYAIGGMDSDNKPTGAVIVFDTTQGTWTPGPDLPPSRFKGFACSAIAQDGEIFANTFQGDLLRLSSDGTLWEVVGRLEHPRMAHRLVKAGTSQLIALGGEDGEDKRPELELLTPSTPSARLVQSSQR